MPLFFDTKVVRLIKWFEKGDKQMAEDLPIKILKIKIDSSARIFVPDYCPHGIIPKVCCWKLLQSHLEEIWIFYSSCATDDLSPKQTLLHAMNLGWWKWIPIQELQQKLSIPSGKRNFHVLVYHSPLLFGVAPSTLTTVFILPSNRYFAIQVAPWNLSGIAH